MAWKWPGNQKVLWTKLLSTEIWPLRNPGTPPTITMKMAPHRNLNGIAARAAGGISPCHRVAIQLKTCSVLGTMMSMVVIWKNRCTPVWTVTLAWK